MSIKSDPSQAIGFSTNNNEIEVLDKIEHYQLNIELSHSVAPKLESPESFTFPVDKSISIEAESIKLDDVFAIYIRKPNGKQVGQIESNNAEKTWSQGEYIVEICAPIKLYLEINSSISISTSIYETKICFGKTTKVAVGARSEHRHPVAEIVSTEKPVDMMKAISAFSSSLKTITPERSYPTLRGHPPTVRLGDELKIPKNLKPLDTGISIEVRPRLEDIFPASTLAYYLGAMLVRGDKPKLTTEDGFSYEFDLNDFEISIEKTLKQIFLLDCVTRTEGLYEIDLYEREKLEDSVDFEIAEVYESPITSQIETYLDIPYSVISEFVPRWGLSAIIENRPRSIETLPYLIDDLALIHPRHRKEIPSVDFSLDLDPSIDYGRALSSIKNRYNSVERVWVGEEFVVGASKGIRSGFEHRFDRPLSDREISIAVVCNDHKMNNEQSVIEDVFANDANMEVEIYQDISTNDLKSILQSSIDFFHYIGHIDEDGFNCEDGRFDANRLDQTGVGSFFLNACESYSQGKRLIETGSIGGIVTLSKVVNSSAIFIGSMVARLLNNGFPLYCANYIIQDESILGSRYFVIGDGRMTLVQPESTPSLLDIQTGKGNHDVNIMSFPTSRIDIGSMVVPYIGSNEQFHLVSQSIPTYTASTEDLLDHLSLQSFPVRINGEHKWSSDVTKDDLNIYE